MGKLWVVSCEYFREYLPWFNEKNVWFQDMVQWTSRGRLTLKHWETHGCLVSTVSTDALMLKHQVISILNAD